MDFVQNILNIAKEQGYTNKQLCELLGKNPSYISDWKSGKSKPKADEIILLAKEFDVSADDLLGSKKAAPQEQPLSEKQETVLKLSEQLTDEDLKKLIDYAELLRKAKNQ